MPAWKIPRVNPGKPLYSGHSEGGPFFLFLSNYYAQKPEKKRWGGSKVLVRAFEGITFALLLAPRNKVLTFILEKELNLKVKSWGILMESPHLSPEHTKARTLLPPFFLSVSRTEARLTARFQLLGLKLHCFRGDLNSPKVTLLSREGLFFGHGSFSSPSFYRFKVKLFCFLEQVNTTFRFSF